MGDLPPAQISLFVFLRSTAAEMRRLAERAPELAIELRHIARQLDAELDRVTSTNSFQPHPGVASNDG